MKYILILLIALPLGSAAQYSKLSAGWRVGKTKNMYGSDITRLAGKSSTMSTITNAAFQTRQWTLDELNERAELEMWSKETFDEKAEYFLSDAYHGTVHIYMERASVGAVDPSVFTCVIQDTTGTEITRIDFDWSTGRYSSGKWWNSAIEFVDVPLPRVFLLHIIDRVLEERHTFRVSVPD